MMTSWVIHHPVTDDTGTLVGVVSQQADGLWLASILPANRTQLITSTWQPLATEAEARERVHRHLAQRGPACADCGDTGRIRCPRYCGGTGIACWVCNDKGTLPCGRCAAEVAR